MAKFEIIEASKNPALFHEQFAWLFLGVKSPLGLACLSKWTKSSKTATFIKRSLQVHNNASIQLDYCQNSVFVPPPSLDDLC